MNPEAVIESVDIRRLMEEIDRYRAAVDLFRAEGCEPAWHPEPGAEPEATATAPVAPRLPSDLRLH